MTLIIGKRSNLSKELQNNLKDSVLISSVEIENDIEQIGKYCNDKSINIIFNNFQASTRLNDNTNFELYIKNTILNTSKVLTYLVDKKIKINKLIYTSSSSVYGNNNFCTENDQVQPMSLQGALKVANEELIKRFCMTYNINHIIVRLFNMYGKNDRFSVINKIKNAHRNDEILNIINNGMAIRDYVYIGDVVNVYKILINEIDKLPTILNIATGKGKMISDILSKLNSVGITLETKNSERHEINDSIADVTLLSKIVNIEEFVDVDNYLFRELKK